eukprot:XP_016661141.1 PREDICTED: facilitated trehalose transporter Tret1 [Acyrthosiphon pisum]
MKNRKLQCHLKLIFCFTMMCFIQFLVGFLYTFSSTLLEQLREPSSTIHLSIEEESWITSITMLICPIGLLIIGILTDKFGRRKTIQFICAPMALGWLIITFSNSYTALLIGKIILGIPFGVSTCTFLYISELSPTNLRPLYITLVPFTVGLGMMAESILAMYCRWQTISGIMLAVSVVNFLTLFMVPEPPIWLRARGRAPEADEVDRWLDLGHITHASDASADVVEQSVVAMEVDDNVHATPAAPTSLSSSPYWSLFLRRNVWLPTVVTLTFFVFQQCSGVYVLLFYSMDVVRDCKMPMGQQHCFAVPVFGPGDRCPEFRGDAPSRVPDARHGFRRMYGHLPAHSSCPHEGIRRRPGPPVSDDTHCCVCNVHVFRPAGHSAHTLDTMRRGFPDGSKRCYEWSCTDMRICYLVYNLQNISIADIKFRSGNRLVNIRFLLYIKRFICHIYYARN